jgi:hypothetical protein
MSKIEKSMRALSEEFMEDLREGDGCLSPLLKRVRKDDTLMLAIRDGYINIYYRGGSILKLVEKKSHKYQTFFDSNYNKLGGSLPDLPPEIQDIEQTIKWVEAVPHLKEIMDFYFSSFSKLECEFQQLVVRENNSSNYSNESEYFISDIELADANIGARFDMTAIRWLANDRQKARRCKVAFIEMKYGDKALKGKSGLLKHLKDFNELIQNEEGYEIVRSMVVSQFNQLDELGLVNYNKSETFSGMELITDKPEVIFLLGNHNQRSTILSKELEHIDFDKYDQSKLFDLRFYVASFAGYGLHSDNMLSLKQMRMLLSNKLSGLLVSE